ncbi:uncharacterized protein LOC124479586 isoform X2 [Hypomesus transpacificus]|uniref:uncharacterized protein LOC124479586 isoform X2 n=1 Tax=Hypomesus transpacificus TaxID=137520 RepID=UPI001F07618D|nr:uncharacterized protein LOC124479586 isoform X2 [Hypomesus transpacificus]
MAQWQVLHVGGSLTAEDRRRGQSSKRGRYPHAYGTQVSMEYPPNRISGDHAFSVMPVDGKVTLQDLNERLASYIDKVNSLEAANHQLTLQIRDHLENSYPADFRELDTPLKTVEDLKKQISEQHIFHTQLKLQTVNTEQEAHNYNTKYEEEHRRRVVVSSELDFMQRLQGELLFMNRHLHLQLNQHAEDMDLLKTNHEEVVQEVLSRLSEPVAVEMDCAPSADLTQVLDHLHTTCLALVQKNQAEADTWFHRQAELLRHQVSVCPAGSEEGLVERRELERTRQALEVTLHKQQAQNQSLEANMAEVDERFGLLLRRLQQFLGSLEAELQHLRLSQVHQAADYQMLLDIKTRLEMEIAEYRRLLNGEEDRTLTFNCKADAPILCLESSQGALMNNVLADPSGLDYAEARGRATSSRVGGQRPVEASRGRVSSHVMETQRVEPSRSRPGEVPHVPLKDARSTSMGSRHVAVDENQGTRELHKHPNVVTLEPVSQDTDRTKVLHSTTTDGSPEAPSISFKRDHQSSCMNEKHINLAGGSVQASSVETREACSTESDVNMNTLSTETAAGVVTHISNTVHRPQDDPPHLQSDAHLQVGEAVIEVICSWSVSPGRGGVKVERKGWSVEPTVLDARAETGVLGSAETGVLGSAETGVLGSTETGVLGSAETGVLGSAETGVLGSADLTSDVQNKQVVSGEGNGDVKEEGMFTCGDDGGSHINVDVQDLSPEQGGLCVADRVVQLTSVEYGSEVTTVEQSDQVTSVEHVDQVTSVQLGYQVTIVKNEDHVSSVEHVDQVTSVKHDDQVTSVEHGDQVTSLEQVDQVTSVEHVGEVTNLEQVDQVTSVEHGHQVTIVDQVTSVENRDEVTSVEHVDQMSSVQLGDQVTSVQLGYQVNSVEHVDQVTSVEHSDQVTSVEHGDQVTSVEHVDQVTSVQLGDKVTSVQLGYQVTSVEHVDQVTSVEHGDQVTSVEHVDQVTSVQLGDQVTSVELGYQVTSVEHGSEVTNVEHGDQVTSVQHSDQVASVEHSDQVTSVQHSDQVASVEHGDQVTSVQHSDQVASVEHGEKTSGNQKKKKKHHLKNRGKASTAAKRAQVESEVELICQGADAVTVTDRSSAVTPVQENGDLVSMTRRKLTRSGAVIVTESERQSHISIKEPVLQVESVGGRVSITSSADGSNTMSPSDLGVEAESTSGLGVEAEGTGGQRTVTFTTDHVKRGGSAKTGGVVHSTAGGKSRMSSANSGGMLSSSANGGMLSRSASGGMLSSSANGGMLSSSNNGGMLSHSASGGMLSRSASGGMLSSSASGGMLSRSASGGMLSRSASGGMLSSSTGAEADSEDCQGARGAGRINREGSGEWMVYGMSTGSSAGSGGRLSSTGSGGRLSTAGSGSRLSTAGSGGRLSTGGSGGRLSTAGIGGRLSTAGSGGRLSTGGSGGRLSTAGSGGRLSSTGSGGRLNSTGSGGRLSMSSSGRSVGGGGMVSGGAGAGKTGSGSGCRVITSSSSGVMIRSTGSGSGTSRERISVCKMAVMKMSAAGKGRSQESPKEVSGSNPRIQKWMNTSDEVVGDPVEDNDFLHVT